jgi:lipopolysaccharide/colanic/teichoic acid biosynthesis glycosyltransferase
MVPRPSYAEQPNGLSGLLGSIICVRRVLGQHGVPFDMYKVRTMVKDADALRDEVAHLPRDSFGKIIGDPRILPFAHFSRAHWFDELPQLVNVGRGDMKPVGIRPMPEDEWTSLYPDSLMSRALEHKPGLMAIPYAFPRTGRFEDRFAQMIKYLDAYERDPEGTDREYFRRIVHNIVVGGVRSS